MSGAWDASHGPSRLWRSGPWELELRDDELADVSLNGHPVLRSIRAVVRDRDWNTATWLIERIDESAGSLVLVMRSDGYGSDITARLEVSASSDTLSVAFEAVPAADFATNRTGLVVLHPPHLAGNPLRVTHPDGSVETTRFPESISPHQPVFDIARLEWGGDGASFDLRFSGDIFEMEDQRNWTDASYKTYSRPLALPFPYLLPAGEAVRQSVTVIARGGGTRATPAAHPRLVLQRAGSFPEVAVGASTAPDPAPSVTPVGSSLLVELDLASPTWLAALQRAASSKLPLDVRLVMDDSDPGAVRAAARALRGHPIVRVAAFWASGPAAHVSDDAAVELLRDALSAAGLEVAVVGGARSHFTELNREQHRLPRDLDGVVFSVTPLFHSLTTEQLIESLAMQRLVSSQAVALAGGAPVHIGPVTLRPRFNNVATTPPPVSAHSDLSAGYGPELIDAVDPRQSSPELAAWAIASAAALAVSGVASLTYFEEWGPRGIRTREGAALPVAAAIQALSDLAGTTLLTVASPDASVWAIGGESDAGSTVLLANASASPRELIVVLDGDEHRRVVPGLDWFTLHIPHP